MIHIVSVWNDAHRIKIKEVTSLCKKESTLACMAEHVCYFYLKAKEKKKKLGMKIFWYQCWTLKGWFFKYNLINKSWSAVCDYFAGYQGNSCFRWSLFLKISLITLIKSFFRCLWNYHLYEHTLNTKMVGRLSKWKRCTFINILQNMPRKKKISTYHLIIKDQLTKFSCSQLFCFLLSRQIQRPLSGIYVFILNTKKKPQE